MDIFLNTKYAYFLDILHFNCISEMMKWPFSNSHEYVQACIPEFLKCFLKTTDHLAPPFILKLLLGILYQNYTSIVLGDNYMTI